MSPFWTWVIRGTAIVVPARLRGALQRRPRDARCADRRGWWRTSGASRRRRRSFAQVGPLRIRSGRPAYKNFYELNNAALNAPVGRLRARRVLAPDPRRTDRRRLRRVPPPLRDGRAGPRRHGPPGVPRAVRREARRRVLRLPSGHGAEPAAGLHALPRRARTEADAPSRIGLKGAYHRQCIGCHERQLKPASAPTACNACHHPWTPDHGVLVSLPPRPTAQDVTRGCLSCHAKTGQDILNTAHWTWKGYSPTLKGYEHRIDISLTLMVNNTCISIGSNMQAVRVVPHRVRLGGREVRLHRSRQHRLPRVPRHHGDVPQGPRPRRAARPGARPGGDCAEGRPPVAPGVRLVPLRQRRRPLHQARRPRARAGRSAAPNSTCTWARSRCAARTATRRPSTASPACR